MKPATDNNDAQRASKRARKRTDRRGHEAPCPIMRACGGCEWLGLPYRKQLARKQAAMEELFAPLGLDIAIDPIVPMRAGGIGAISPTGTNGADNSGGPEPRNAESEATAAPRPLASPRAFRYKAATPFAPGPRGRVRCGFYARGTHDIVFCPACAVEAPGARRILNEVSRIATRLRIPAYDEDRATGLLRHAVLRMGWRTDEAMLTLVTRSRQVPRLREFAAALRDIDPRIVTVAQNINPRIGNAILGGETRVLFGPPRMRDKLLGCTFEISPTSFYQTNPAQTELLYHLAIEGMDLHEGDTLLDAYCGSGTIGLCAADRARERGIGVRLLGVERNPEGIRDARRNAHLNDLEDASEFVAEDATAYMQRMAADGQRVDVVCLDPPRAGSTPEFLAAAAALAPRRIVYISCNPVTQARDLKQLTQAGYRALRLVPVDMFPHTAHVETVAVLSRKSASKSFIPVSISPKDMGLSEKKDQPTYANICDYVQKTHGMKVSSLYVAQMKAECGLETQADRSGDKKQPKCPPEKREAILDAFRHFGLIGEDETEK